tara:strand:+ start:140363 stop:142999 length:2637 start_codon:yes stop_codon:yes gene_type:complete
MGEDLVGFDTLFCRQVQLTPDRVAVIQDDRVLTYRQLSDLASAFARKLLSVGVVHGDHVGLCLDRSPEAIAAMLGVFRIGAIFVPLDPEYPVDRLVFMVQDASISAIIAEPEHRAMLQQDLSDGITERSAEIAWVDTAPGEASEMLPAADVSPSDVAYVMYTSGSTGKPKGVQIEHAALAAYCFADIDIYQVVPDDRTLQFSTLNFDIAIEEIFPPLLTGGAVVVRPTQRADARNELSSIVLSHDVTAIHLATAYWHQWVDLMVASDEQVPPSIRLMIVTGEKVSVEHYRRWQSICDHNVLWCNAYGPTEATVSATVFVPGPDFDAANMPIGKPMKRYETVILNDSLGEVRDGETGQLYIGGPALARGYLNRPDLTEQAFVTTGGPTPRRLYRTGDLARWLPDGNIDFAGRIDHQIKLGSYRIEPAEIEAALDQHASVLESLVSYDELDGSKYLIAYVAVGNNQPDAADLSGFLRDRLPSYMVPTRYALMTEFPKTINGKIDRTQLKPCQSVVAREKSYVAPRNDLETKLCHLWQEVLNVPEVGIHDDFFLLGGSSLLVTQVVTRLTAELQIELPVRDFFANPTVATAAQHLAYLSGEQSAAGLAGGEDEFASRRARLPRLEPGYFDSGRDRLFAMHYRPPQRARRHAVLMCHAYGHEYARSFRNLQQLAVQLCQAGFDVMRFDYVGSGNSTGDCDRATLEQMRSDIGAAVQHMRLQCSPQKISGIGVRLGATALATSGLNGLSQMILWDPVLSGSGFLSDLQRFHANALTGLNRFQNVRETGAIDQLFGHRMNPRKRESFAHAALPQDGTSRAEKQWIVTSRGYLERESRGFELSALWPCVMTEDEIRWHDPAYTESAFSSPEIYRVILDALQAEAE